MPLVSLREFAEKIGVCTEGTIRDISLQVLAAEEARSHWPYHSIGSSSNSDFGNRDDENISYAGPKMPTLRVLSRSKKVIRSLSLAVEVSDTSGAKVDDYLVLRGHRYVRKL